MDIDDCPYGTRCTNNEECYRCWDETLLSLPENKGRIGFSGIKIHDNVVATADDSWKDLEQTVANKINNVPTIKVARRSRMSGALEYETGDIVDEILHPECKERTGRLLKSGDKTISLSKAMLEKAKKECMNKGTTMVLPFRFKEDDSIYGIMDFDDVAELITTQKALVYDNDRLSQELLELRKVLKEYAEPKRV